MAATAFPGSQIQARTRLILLQKAPWGDAVGFALANDFGPLKEQSTNFLMDAAGDRELFDVANRPARMFGIDPQTKKFTKPPEQIKEQIAALKIDKSVSEAEKKEDLRRLEAALKETIQFKEIHRG